MKSSIFGAIFLLYVTSTKSADPTENCTFMETPEKLSRVSKSPDIKVKIAKHFELSRFPEACLLKVELPNGIVVTFNLTKDGDGDRYFGDKFTDQVWVNRGRDMVFLYPNTSAEFGSRYGSYYINGFEVVGIYYVNAEGRAPDANDVVLRNCDKPGEETGHIQIDDLSKNDARMKICIDYNEGKNKSIEEFLFGENCRSSENITLENRTLNFPAKYLPLELCCQIDVGTDKEQYKNKIPAKNTPCSISTPSQLNQGNIKAIVVTVVLFAVAALMGGYFLYRHKKKRYKRRYALDNLKPKVPEWGRSLSHDRGHIKMEDIIGKGTFGIVYKAVAQQFEERICNVEVAVKTYPTESIQGHDDLFREGKVLIGLKYHPNIINLLGISLDTVEFHNRLLLIIELCSKGCLLDYLRKKDDAFTNETETWTDDFNPEIMTLWSFQISSGMEFLSMNKIIHGDLAARNILLDGDSNIKINDFGKARQVSYDNIAVVVDGIQPLAWMALEAIQKQQITLQSDIWSFGVTLWEIYSLGLHPYAERSFQETFESLQLGERLPSPSRCPSQKIYQLMTDTWNEDPEQRPSFKELSQRLRSMVDNKYLKKYWQIQDRQRKVYERIRNYSADKKNKGQNVVVYTNDAMSSTSH